MPKKLFNRNPYFRYFHLTIKITLKPDLKNPYLKNNI